MTSSLRASLACLLLIPAMSIGAFWWAYQATGAHPATLWPWVALSGAFCVTAPLTGRWAGVRDWGFIPFLTVAGIAVPWWGAAILIWLLLLHPAGIVIGILFWFAALGALALLSLLAG